MKVLITGAGGFVGKNLQQHLAERANVEVVCFTRANTAQRRQRSNRMMRAGSPKRR